MKKSLINSVIFLAILMSGLSLLIAGNWVEVRSEIPPNPAQLETVLKPVHPATNPVELWQEEITAERYELIHRLYSFGKPSINKMIDEAMKDGKINNKEYLTIAQMALKLQFEESIIWQEV
jgi:hypothetical protein